MRAMCRPASGVVVAVLLLSACGEDTGDAVATGDLDLVSPATLTVCSDVPFKPFGFEDPDSPIGYRGFDIDLVTEIAHHLAVDVAVVSTDFEDLATGSAMAAGTCDLAASAVAITETRAAQIDFSDPYYDAMQSLLVAEGTALSSIDELVEGMVVGVQSGAAGETYAERNVPGADIRAFESIGDLMVALETGQVDAILHDLPTSVEFARGTAAEVVADYDSGQSYGFAMAQDRTDGLVDAINAALAEIREDGTYDEVFDRYFGVD